MNNDLRKIPGIGENMERHLHDIGINCIKDLRGKDPEVLFDRNCILKGVTDRCVLYAFRLAVCYAENEDLEPEKLKWWYWKDKEYRPKSR